MIAAISTIAVVALAACSGGGAPIDQQSGATPSNTTQAAIAALASDPAGGAPRAVADVGTYAEDGYDAVRATKWSVASAYGDSLGQAAASLPAALKAQDASTAAVHESIASLATAVGGRDRIAGMRAANHITYLAARLGASSHTQTPTEVVLLDYYGRELEIGGMTRDTAALHRTVRDIGVAWHTLRPLVEARGGTQEAVRFDGLVARVRQATSPVEAGRLATAVLDEVDKLELVFTR